MAKAPFRWYYVPRGLRLAKVRKQIPADQLVGKKAHGLDIDWVPPRKNQTVNQRMGG